ncbi:MAG: exodeoxyribonuclease VII small subunit [Chloroflexi bacterium]|nr:exodeoxyribonuclease VII small subunit [Chloroflexota bacterium]MDA1002016.1 exodeoxyribonuclease VII small subunit [Chloroflexota bacterium]
MATRSTKPSAAGNDPPSADDDSSAPETFEAAYERLEEISNQLEAGGLSLERSVDLYEEGMRLAARCQDLLTNVEQRIETLRQRAGDAGGDAGR